MIISASKEHGGEIRRITAHAGVFSQDEVQSLAEIWEEHITHGAESSGYYFLIAREEERILGYACYGPRDYALAPGVFDLYWIAVDPAARQKGIGRMLINACEDETKSMGARMIIAETSGTPHYEATRKFYLGVGYNLEAAISDFYAQGDDLNIFVKRF